MGIELDDPITGNNCPLCWPVDESPGIMLASFSGIKIGDDWEPPDIYPANKIFALGGAEWPCTYELNDADWFIRWDTSPFFTNIHAKGWAGGGAFFAGQVVGPCAFGFSNLMTIPENSNYWSGNCSISFVPAGLAASLTTIAGLVGFTVDPTIRADFWPDGDETVNRFVDHKTNSRLRITRET